MGPKEIGIVCHYLLRMWYKKSKNVLGQVINKEMFIMIQPLNVDVKICNENRPTKSPTPKEKTKVTHPHSEV